MIARDIVTVSAQDLVDAPELWPRSGLDEQRVEYLCGLYEIDADVPAIAVVADGERLVVADGHHRLEALRRRGVEEVVVRRVVPSEGRSATQEIVLLAVEMAAMAALPLTAADRRRAVDLLREYCPDLSIAEVARRTGYSREGASRRLSRLRKHETPPPPPPLAQEPPNALAEVAGQVVRSLIRLERVGEGDAGRITSALAQALAAECRDAQGLGTRARRWLGAATRRLGLDEQATAPLSDAIGEPLSLFGDESQMLEVGPESCTARPR